MQICHRPLQVSSSGNRHMRSLTLFAFLVPALLVIGLTSSTLTNSVSGLSTQYNTAPPVSSKMSVTTQNVAQINNPVNFNPFEEIQKLNYSNTLISQGKHTTNVKPDINSIKAIIKSDIKNRLKFPIDIPFP